jgi:hypothetical protein
LCGNTVSYSEEKSIDRAYKIPEKEILSFWSPQISLIEGVKKIIQEIE